MKKLLYIAAVALLTLGMASYERDANNGGTNSPSAPSTPTNSTDPKPAGLSV